MLKLVCFAFALSAAGEMEKVPLGTFDNYYAANAAIIAALDKHNGPPPDCEERRLVTKDDGSTEWVDAPDFDPDRVRVITGYENSRWLMPGEFRFTYRIHRRRR